MADENFELWLAKEKKTFADGGYAENWATFDRIKTRLGGLMTLTTTLLSASTAAAFSGKPYAIVSMFLAVGFFFTDVACVMGLYSTKIRTKHVNSQTIDEILKDLPEENETLANVWLASAIDTINEINDKAIHRDRFWLQCAWIGLVITPILSFFLAFISRIWGCF